ncbi:MAG: hypothetical protein IJS15_10550, partial [Victivallales bacterium]|nr:hypothetical protein [Victivallales bacterium]
NTPGTHVAEAKGIIDDDKWHTAELDLAELVADTTDATFSPIYFGVNEGAAANTKVRLDDVSFIKDIKYVCVVSMTMGDETGIKAFESKISENENDEPDDREDYRSRHLLPLTTTGRKFLHVRARDGAGNASPTLHIPFNVASILPQSQEDGLEKRNNASVIDEDGQGASIVFDKCFSGENTLASVQFYRNRTQRTMILYPCKNKFIPGEISFDLIPLKFNGINVQMVTIGSIEGNNKELRHAIRNNRIHGKHLSKAVQIDNAEEIKRITVKLDKPLEKPPMYVGLLFEPAKSSRDSFLLDNITVRP